MSGQRNQLQGADTPEPDRPVVTLARLLGRLVGRRIACMPPANDNQQAPAHRDSAGVTSDAMSALTAASSAVESAPRRGSSARHSAPTALGTSPSLRVAERAQDAPAEAGEAALPDSRDPLR
jgi:hypothetical protein